MALTDIPTTTLKDPSYSAPLQNQVILSCGEDEKITPVVAYTADFMVWGKVISKECIRVSTWLRTNMAPESVCIFNANVVFPYTGNVRPVSFPELHLQTPKINAFHIMPPACDSLDYDPNEANRKMEPVTAIIGSFRMDGRMRMAQSVDLKKYLEISRESFTPLYDVTITHPSISQMNLPKVNYILIRPSSTAFASRSA